MELFREDLGMSTLIAKYDSERDIVVFDVEERDGKVTHAGDDTCNLDEVLAVYLDDYTSLDRSRLLSSIFQKVVVELMAMDVPDQKAIWAQERREMSS